MKRLKSTPCRRLIWLRRMATAASLLVVASMSACQSSNHSKPDNLSELNLFYPFVFSSSIDPRNVLTVGDSVISDHLFAYHVATTIEKGIRPHFSEVIFNTATQTVSFKVLRDLYYSNGSKLSHVKRCDAIKSSFMGTQHARYKDLVKNVKCSIGGTDIVFDKVPINLRYLLSLPDFSIFDAEKLPVKENSNKNFTTGPYILKSMSSTRVDLDLNVHYPDEFRANKVPKAVINAFDGSRSKQFIQQASPKRQHLIYSPGYSISKADFDRLEEKGYRTHIFSTEWLVHIGFQKAVGLGDRILIGSVIDLNRNSFSEVLELGYPAYSIAPDDRSFGIRKEQYDQITAEIKSKNKTLSKKYKIGTLDEWLKLPIFKAVLDVLKDQL